MPWVRVGTRGGCGGRGFSGGPGAAVEGRGCSESGCCSGSARDAFIWQLLLCIFWGVQPFEPGGSVPMGKFNGIGHPRVSAGSGVLATFNR